MNDPISRNRGKPSARRHVHPEFGVGARAPLTCQRSTHAQDRSLSVRLPSQRRLLRPEFNRWASNCEDRPVPDRVPRQRRLLSWAERRSARRASGRRVSGRVRRERRVQRIEPVEPIVESPFRRPPARFPVLGWLVASKPTKPLYGEIWESGGPSRLAACSNLRLQRFRMGPKSRQTSPPPPCRKIRSAAGSSAEMSWMPGCNAFRLARWAASNTNSGQPFASCRWS